MSANLEDPAVAMDWKRSILIPIPRKGSTYECANHQTIALIFQASKVMLKILHARLQHYLNQELPDVQAGFRKGRGSRDQIAIIHWIIEKAREFQKNTYLCFIDQAKSLTLWIMTNCRKLLKWWEYWTILLSLMRNLYTGGELTVRILYRTTDWFKIKKGVWQGCLVSP